MDKIRKKKIKKGTVEQLVLDERMATVFFSVLDWLFLLITNILGCFAVEKWTRFSLSFCQFVRVWFSGSLLAFHSLLVLESL